MKSFYFDNAATTAPDKEILSSAASFCAENFYNPSAKYSKALRVRSVLEGCRKDILDRYYARKLVFTSCGTEADVTAILSFGKRGNIVTTEGEHAAVYKTFEQLKQRGIEVRYAKLLYGGAVDREDLLSKIDDNTTFVSVVHVNNETGAVNDVNAIAESIKKKNPKVVFHTDAVQSFLKIPFVPNEYVDLFSVSAHKVCAIKGVGALIYNDRLHVNPLLTGGGQEDGIRSGTENVLGIKTFADAFKKYYPDVEKNYIVAEKMKKAFTDILDKKYFRILSPIVSSPYILSISAVSLRGEVIQSRLDDLGYIIGTGSACSSKAPHSRILKAFEGDAKVLDGALRISFIFDTDISAAIECAETLNAVAAELYGKMNAKR